MPSASERAARGFPLSIRRPARARLLRREKRSREFHGRRYLLETALTADFALIKAWKGDRLGNLIYRKTARNFNPMMATAARVTIAEVEEIVEPGAIDPDHVVTPGVYVQRIVAGAHYEKRIERRTTRRK